VPFLRKHCSLITLSSWPVDLSHKHMKARCWGHAALGCGPHDGCTLLEFTPTIAGMSGLFVGDERQHMASWHPGMQECHMTLGPGCGEGTFCRPGVLCLWLDVRINGCVCACVAQGTCGCKRAQAAAPCPHSSYSCDRKRWQARAHSYVGSNYVAGPGTCCSASSAGACSMDVGSALVAAVRKCLRATALGDCHNT
jgi:hypothetical protein